MPGPVSQSYDPCATDREAWQRKLAKDGFRYFVLKAEDVFKYLDSVQLEALDEVLAQIEHSRAQDSKPPSLAYWVYARHWPNASEIKQRMEQALGHPIGQPYDIDEE